MSQRDELYRAILADPDRNEPRRRYAEYLDQQGDELGEYIRLSLAKAHGTLDPSRHARFLALDATMNPRLGGALQGWVRSWELDRGLVAKVTMDGAFFLAHGPAVFTRAPVQHVDLVNAKSMLGAIVQNPLLSHVRTLRLSNNGLDDHDAELLAGSPYARRLVYLDLDTNRIGRAGIEAIAGSPNLAGLRALFLADNAVESPVSTWVDDGRSGLVEHVGAGLLQAELVATFGRKAWMDVGPHLDRFRMCDVAD